jgi:hypothetical protein
MVVRKARNCCVHIDQDQLSLKGHGAPYPSPPLDSEKGFDGQVAAVDVSVLLTCVIAWLAHESARKFSMHVKLFSEPLERQSAANGSRRQRISCDSHYGID